MQSVQDYTNMLEKLMSGNIKPSEVVGTGYRYPRSTASGWIRKQLHLLQDPNKKINEVFVKTDGRPFDSQCKAMRSRHYQALLDGSYRTINDSVVESFYIARSAIGDGFEVHVRYA